MALLSGDRQECLLESAVARSDAFNDSQCGELLFSSMVELLDGAIGRCVNLIFVILLCDVRGCPEETTWHRRQHQSTAKLTRRTSVSYLQVVNS